ncbi:MAG: hypothetical protein HRU38_15145 [Saccharospirillaceae bacterium]|nr:hypothetical protein [Saccharospirillaceae bacterium]
MFSSITCANFNPYEKWKSIKTEHFNILFMASSVDQAQALAVKLEDSLKAHNSAYDIKHWKNIDVVLSSRSIEPNGYVSPLPMHSAFYNGPAALSGMPWMDTLAIHETRHIVQMYKSRDQGGKRLMYYIGGDTLAAVMQLLFIPAWFFEGDAVLSETVLTQAGRGRSAAFEMPTRTLELENIHYDYYRNYLGRADDQRYRNNHYLIGYHIASYVSRHFGVKAWNDIVDLTANNVIYPNFNNAIKQITNGQGIQDIYEASINERKEYWMSIKGNNDAFEIISAPNKYWQANVHAIAYPKQDSQSILTVNFNKAGGTHLSLIDPSKNSQKIDSPSLSLGYELSLNQKRISLANGNVLWTKQSQHPRWASETYSDIYVHNLETANTNKLSTKGKYVSASLNNDASLVLGFSYNQQNKASLDIFDLSCRPSCIKQTIPLNGEYYDFSWADNNQYVLAKKITTNGNAIVKINLATEQESYVINPTFAENLRGPIVYKNYVIYQSDLNGIDSIYAIDTQQNSKRYLIVKPKHGAFFPQVLGADLIFSNYSINGYQLAKMPLDPAKWQIINNNEQTKPQDPSLQNHYLTQLPVVKFESANNPTNKPYTVEDYSPLLQAINIHSWSGQVSNDKISASLSSADALSVLNANVTAGYNVIDNSPFASANLTVNRWYPLLTFNGKYDEVDVSENNKFSNLQKAGVGLDVSIPLFWHLNSGILSINVGTKSQFDQLNLYGEDSQLLTNQNRLYQKIHASMLIAKQPAMLATRTRQALSLQSAYYIDDMGYRLAQGSGSLWLPGISQRDSIKISLSGYQTNNEFGYYYDYSPGRILKDTNTRYQKYYNFRIDYKMPLAYISKPIGGFIYFRGVDTSWFFETSTGQSGDEFTGKKILSNIGNQLNLPVNILSNLNFKFDLAFINAFNQDGDYFTAFKFELNL